MAKLGRILLVYFSAICQSLSAQRLNLRLLWDLLSIFNTWRKSATIVYVLFWMYKWKLFTTHGTSTAPPTAANNAAQPLKFCFSTAALITLSCTVWYAPGRKKWAALLVTRVTWSGVGAGARNAQRSPSKNLLTCEMCVLNECAIAFRYFHSPGEK